MRRLRDIFKTRIETPEETAKNIAKLIGRDVKEILERKQAEIEQKMNPLFVSGPYDGRISAMEQMEADRKALEDDARRIEEDWDLALRG